MVSYAQREPHWVVHAIINHFFLKLAIETAAGTENADIVTAPY